MFSMDQESARELIRHLKLRVTSNRIDSIDDLTLNLPTYEIKAINSYVRTYQEALIRQQDGTLGTSLKRHHEEYKGWINDSIEKMAGAGAIAGALLSALSISSSKPIDPMIAGGIGAAIGGVSLYALETAYYPLARMRGVPGKENLVGSKEYVKKKDEELESILLG